MRQTKQRDQKYHLLNTIQCIMWSPFCFSFCCNQGIYSRPLLTSLLFGYNGDDLQSTTTDSLYNARETYLAECSKFEYNPKNGSEDSVFTIFGGTILKTHCFPNKQSTLTQTQYWGNNGPSSMTLAHNIGSTSRVCWDGPVEKIFE